MTLFVQGIGVSRGIALGQVRLVAEHNLNFIEYSIAEQQLDAEIARYQDAVQRAITQLTLLRNHAAQTLEANLRSIIDTHILMLGDEAFLNAPVGMIRSRLCNAEWALNLQKDILIGFFDTMDDPYLRSRRDDITHVSNQILRNLSPTETTARSRASALKNCVVVAPEITPAEVILYHHEGILGLISASGGPLSHAAIIARGLNIPMIAGLNESIGLFKNHEAVVMDGHTGCIFLDADSCIQEHYKQQQKQSKNFFTHLLRLRSLPAISRDGESIELLANIEQHEDIKLALEHGANGVGLFRTEMLFLNRTDPPSEDEQLNVFCQALKSLQGKPLTIRTLDLGSDKLPHLDLIDHSSSNNPALGLRAIRLCLKNPGLFHPHLRAILRASALGPIKIMLPMVTSLQEIVQVKSLLVQMRKELQHKGHAVASYIPLGAMIEVPAAAINAYDFATQVDFLSIGTNDLIQYTLAIDRTADEINYLYEPLNPAILRLIHFILRGGRKAGKPVSLCGEMAGQPEFTRLLLGLGLRQFSMHPSHLLEVKSEVAQTDIKAIRHKVYRLLTLNDSDQIAQQLQKL